MITLDLRKSLVTIDELLQLASGDPVLLVNRDGNQFVVEAADAFEREAAALGQSAKFMSFLAKRGQEPGSLTLEEIDRRVAEAESQ
jgi:hypothetical protein